MSARLKNIVILISGAGTNMAAIIRAAQTQNWESLLGARVVAVISSHADASGLALAQALGVATQALDHRGFESRAAFDAALQARIDAHSPALVVLAGFMRILTPGFVARYAGRLLNIHPSLLPSFRGLDAVGQALAAGVQLTGCTAHLVRPEVDAGPVLVQAAVPVLPGDDHRSLSARIQRQEHAILPLAVALAAARLAG